MVGRCKVKQSRHWVVYLHHLPRWRGRLRFAHENKENRTMKERNVWVDYAKAIGIILVVYGHVARGVFNAGLPMDEAGYTLVDSIIYSFHMPLFSFCRGCSSTIRWSSAGRVA